jgi:hypothetical protein
MTPSTSTGVHQADERSVGLLASILAESEIFVVRLRPFMQTAQAGAPDAGIAGRFVQSDSAVRPYSNARV